MEQTASGPGRVSRKTMTGIPFKKLVSHFNLWLLAEHLPEWLLVGRKVFIAKVAGSQEPMDFRPITVASVLARVFHKCLAARLEDLDNNIRQKGSKRVDGTATKSLLQGIISEAKTQRQGLKLASIDVKKAFDSLTLKALVKAALEAGMDHKILRCIMKGCKRQGTKLEIDEARRLVKPAKGVRHGDPISPILFNLVINSVRKTLPQTTGIQSGAEKLNHFDFADDVVLLARTQTGLQDSINRLETGLEKCGLSQKCANLDVATVPRDRQILINPNTEFSSRAGGLPLMKAESFYKYLGIETGAHGTETNTIKELKKKLDDLRRAPLKPHQRIWILKTYCIPSVYHQVVIAETRQQVLGGVDRVIRSS